MKTERQRCTFCRLVEHPSARGMIDENDTMIIVSHVRRCHTLEGTVDGIER